MSDLTLHEATRNPEAEVDSESGFTGLRTSARIRARRAQVWAWFTSEFRPPEIAHSRPGIADTIRYARHGEQVPPEGFGRLLMLLYGFLIAVPIRVVLACLDWVFERPTRLLALFGLYAVLAHTPFGRFLPWF